MGLSVAEPLSVPLNPNHAVAIQYLMESMSVRDYNYVYGSRFIRNARP